MRKFTLMLLLLSTVAFSFAKELTQQFKDPRGSVQTSIYWYWINNNLSKSGAIKDLEAMKSEGIDRAFIGLIGLDKDGPEMGEFETFSPEWWDILHAVLKRAGELDIQIGLFNSPGWSQSGGPWVTSDRAMRYLKSYEYIVESDGAIDLSLPELSADFQQVKVLAFPKPYGYTLKLPTPASMSGEGVSSVENMMDGDTLTSIVVKRDVPAVIEFSYDAPVKVSSLSLSTARTRNIGDCELWVKRGSEYSLVKEFSVDRYNYNIMVGFMPTAPVVISFNEIQGSEFKLVARSEDKEMTITELSLSETPILDSYVEKSFGKMYQQILPMWHEYQWDMEATPYGGESALSLNDVRDVTQYVKNGHLCVDLPKGEWVIQRAGMLPTGVHNLPAVDEARGLETDKMNKEHIRYHFEQYIGDVLKRIPAEDRKTLKYVVADSYETGGQNFTDGMLKVFEDRYHYDPTPYLPVFNGVVVGDSRASDRFLWDFRRLVADKIAYDYVGGLRQVCNEHGLLLWLENYGHWGFPAEFLQYGGQADEVAGEFWSYGNMGSIENRAASSCGHIYGKNRISAESFTCDRVDPFSRYPAEMKQRGDKFFSEGINSTLLHLYISQPDDRVPGINAWFGNEFNRNNTWFQYMHLFTDYLKRVNLMLQQGTNIADVAYYIGENTPKMTGVRNPELPQGYQFDYINYEVILRDMSVKDGYLTLPHGTRYRVLVLPPQQTMRPEMLQKLQELIGDGAIVLGDAPQMSPSNEGQPYADAQITTIVDELWGDNPAKACRKVGKGRLYSGYTMEEIFEDIDLAEDVHSTNSSLLYSHRECEDKDIYFITNQEGKSVDVDLTFRSGSRYVNLWNAVDGAMYRFTDFERNGDFTSMSLSLQPFESVFVLFEDELNGEEKVIYSPFATQKIESQWDIAFKNPRIDVDESIKATDLTAWNNSDNSTIKHYSGVATYTTEFKVDRANFKKSKSIELDIEKLVAMGKVYINDNYVGGVWTAPYKVDITDYLKAGKNSVRVEVVNTWVNRLIGDAAIPFEDRLTYTSLNPWRANSPLQDSGIMGDVNIIFNK